MRWKTSDDFFDSAFKNPPNVIFTVDGYRKFDIVTGKIVEVKKEKEHENDS